MLTDYHVHLRPDDPGTPAAAYFTTANADRYREVASDRGIVELGVAEHVHRFEQALDVWQHPFWRESARDDLGEYCRFVREETDLRLGIEADWVSGREDRMAALLDDHEWDYVIGSVHFIRDRGVDSDYGGDWDIWDTARSPDEVWKAYFETLAHAAESGLYDIMAHPDLVKVWGTERPLPEKDPRYYYEPAVEAMAGAGVAAEVSTAGLRKAAGEIYPAPALMEMLVDAGVPIALSSDAHVPDQLGFRYEDALTFLADHGVKEIATFQGRTRRMEPIG